MSPRNQNWLSIKLSQGTKTFCLVKLLTSMSKMSSNLSSLSSSTMFLNHKRFSQESIKPIWPTMSWYSPSQLSLSQPNPSRPCISHWPNPFSLKPAASNLMTKGVSTIQMSSRLKTQSMQMERKQSPLKSLRVKTYRVKAYRVSSAMSKCMSRARPSWVSHSISSNYRSNHSHHHSNHWLNKKERSKLLP